MTQIPLPLHLAVASQLGPVIAALVPRRFVGGRRWLVAWCGFGVVAAGVSLALATRGINNHWVTYAALPVDGSLILVTLASWQQWPLARRTVLAAIPLYLVTCALLFLTVEQASTFSAVSEPVYTLLGLTVALFTVLTRSMETTRPLAQQDWFWICGGLALLFGTNAAYHPFARIALAARPDLVIRAVVVKSYVEMIAYAAITIGVLCPTSSRSGASTSPASSPLASSSWRSASPS